jgi:hypothetical protein
MVMFKKMTPERAATCLMWAAAIVISWLIALVLLGSMITLARVFGWLGIFLFFGLLTAATFIDVKWGGGHHG